jgi:hypothetical protein
MSRGKIQVHPEGTPHPTEHTFEELLKRIVSVPRKEVDKHMATEQRHKKKRKEQRSGK